MAFTVVWLPCTEMATGVTSNGVGDVFTPEKAAIPPAEPVTPLPKVNVKLLPSVPSATLYKTAI